MSEIISKKQLTRKLTAGIVSLVADGSVTGFDRSTAKGGRTASYRRFFLRPLSARYLGGLNREPNGSPKPFCFGRSTCSVRLFAFDRAKRRLITAKGASKMQKQTAQRELRHPCVRIVGHHLVQSAYNNVLQYVGRKISMNNSTATHKETAQK